MLSLHRKAKLISLARFHGARTCVDDWHFLRLARRLFRAQSAPESIWIKSLHQKASESKDVVSHVGVPVLSLRQQESGSKSRKETRTWAGPFNLERRRARAQSAKESFRIRILPILQQSMRIRIRPILQQSIRVRIRPILQQSIRVRSWPILQQKGSASVSISRGPSRSFRFFKLPP